MLSSPTTSSPFLHSPLLPHPFLPLFLHASTQWCSQEFTNGLHALHLPFPPSPLLSLVPAKYSILIWLLQYGVMTSDGAIYPELLESFVRDELNRTAARCNGTRIPEQYFPWHEIWEMEVWSILSVEYGNTIIWDHGINIET